MDMNCKECGNRWTGNACHGYKCRKKSCKEYGKEVSKFYIGQCGHCQTDNNLLCYNGCCFKCLITKFRLSYQEGIKKESLKANQIIWEEEKPKMQIKEDAQNESRLTSQEKKDIENHYNELIQTIETDLYPKEKKGSWKVSSWIWLGLTVGIFLLWLWVTFIWWRKSKKEE